LARFETDEICIRRDERAGDAILSRLSVIGVAHCLDARPPAPSVSNSLSARRG